MNQAISDDKIKALFQSLLGAWGKGDPDLYGRHFTDDADYIAFDGVNYKGRETIVREHRPLFEKWLKGSRLLGEIVSIKYLSDDVALVHAKGDTIFGGHDFPERGRESTQSLIAIKKNDEWIFRSFHNSRIRPIGGEGSLRGVFAWMLIDLIWRWIGPQPTRLTAG